MPLCPEVVYPYIALPNSVTSFSSDFQSIFSRDHKYSARPKAETNSLVEKLLETLLGNDVLSRPDFTVDEVSKVPTKFSRP